MNILKGYRTYLCAIAGVIVTGSMYMGYLDMTTGNIILAILGFGGMAALHAAK